MNARPTHPLETWARESFGAGFASVILHGLLDEGGDPENLITVEVVDGRGRERLKTLGMMTHWPERWGLMPLILAALLKRLVGRPEIGHRLDYSYRELLAELFWPDLPASRRAVEDAVESYRACRYSTVDVPAGGGSRLSVRAHHSLIIESERKGFDAPQCDQFSDEGNTVCFLPDFVEGLREGRVVFAGIEFGKFRVRGAASGVGLGQTRGGGTETPPPAVDWPFRPPGPRPVLKFEVTPVSQRPADHRPKMLARAVGETSLSIDTGAIASATLRAINGVAARHPPHRPCPRGARRPSPSTCTAKSTGSRERRLTNLSGR